MNKTITIELDDVHAAELDALAKRLGATPGQVVALALDQFGHEQQDYTPEQIAMIEEGLEELRQGAPEEETEALFTRLRAELRA